MTTTKNNRRAELNALALELEGPVAELTEAQAMWAGRKGFALKIAAADSYRFECKVGGRTVMIGRSSHGWMTKTSGFGVFRGEARDVWTVALRNVANLSR